MSARFTKFESWVSASLSVCGCCFFERFKSWVSASILRGLYLLRVCLRGKLGVCNMSGKLGVCNMSTHGDLKKATHIFFVKKM